MNKYVHKVLEYLSIIASNGGGGGGGGTVELGATSLAALESVTVNPLVTKGIGNVDPDTQRVVLATDQPQVSVNIPDLILVGQAAQTAVVNNILPTTAGAAGTDVSLYRSFGIQVVSTGSGGTFIFEGCNDNVNFQPIPVYNQALAVRTAIVSAITASASQIIYEGSCNFRFIRLRIVSPITGGSIQAFSVFIAESLGTASQIVSNGTAANLLATVSGTVTANIGTGSLSAGTNAIGDVGVQYRANNSGAASRFHLVSAATANATSVKSSAGRLLGWSITNTNAAWRYVKLHNTASAPTAGSGVVQTIGVPPNSVREFFSEGGIAFTTGIGLTTVTGAADADTTVVGVSDLVIDLFFA